MASIPSNGLTGATLHPHEQVGGEGLAAPKDTGRAKSTSGHEKVGLFDEAGHLDEGQPIGAAATQTGGVLSLPVLDAPLQAPSIDDMADVMRDLNERVRGGQLKSAAGAVEASRAKADQNTAKRLEKIDEWTKKCEEAANRSWISKLFSWVGKIAAVIASLVGFVAAGGLSIFSGGAATPLMVLAGAALFASVMALADQVSQELGGPQISIGNLVKTIVSKTLQAFGVPEETADAIGKGAAGALGVMIPALLLLEPTLLSDLVATVCKAAGMSEEATAKVAMIVCAVTAIAAAVVMFVLARKVPDLSVVGKLAGAGGQVVGGLTTLGKGINDMGLAKIRNEGEKALVEQKKLTAMMVQLQQTMEDQAQEIKKLIEQMDEGVQAVSKMIAGATDSMSLISRNIGQSSRA